MSSVESRSRVTSVSGAAVETALSGATSAFTSILGAAALVAGAAVAASIRRACENRVNARTSKMLNRHATDLTGANATGASLKPTVILSAADLPALRADQVVGRTAMGRLECAKVSALAEIAARPLVVRDYALVHQGVTTILAAKTLQEVRGLVSACDAALCQQHQAVLQDACVGVYERAMADIGFTVVDSYVNSNGVARTIGTDIRGRTLVNEISLAGGELSAESEVLGVGDDTCNSVLDQLGQALERNGLRTDDPRRRSTGGCCQTEAARAFVGRDRVESRHSRKAKVAQQTKVRS